MPELTLEDVKARLTSYAAEETTTELYGMGSMLVSECVERMHWLDSKAGALIGYSGASLALFVSTFNIWKDMVHGLGLWAMFFAAVALLVAGIYAVTAVSLRTFDWFSTDDWLKAECLNDPEQLKRFHILTMHGVVQSHDAVSETKTAWIASAQKALVVAGFLLVVMLGDATLKAGGPGTEIATTTSSSSTSTPASSTVPTGQ